MSHSQQLDRQLARYLSRSSRMLIQKDKPGYMTTEFWLTLACIISVTTLLALGKIDINQIDDLWPYLSVVAGYSVSRGLAKRGSSLETSNRD